MKGSPFLSFFDENMSAANIDFDHKTVCRLGLSACLNVCMCVFNGGRDVYLRRAFPLQPSVSDVGGFSQPQRTGRVTNGSSLSRNTDMK